METSLGYKKAAIMAEGRWKIVKYYENIVIFDALLSDEEINTQIEKFKAMIQQLGAKIVHVEIWDAAD